MARIQQNASPVAALIGDVVRSREAADRRALHARLLDRLGAVSARTDPLEALAITVGDEFQATFAHLGQALHAALVLRTELLPGIDTRVGIGWGQVTRLDASTQDGPAWWSAREAIEWVKSAQHQPALRHSRTAYRTTAAAAVPEEAVNAALLGRDHLVGSWDDRSVRILRGLMTDHTQAAVAAAEGISPSAVSQRVRSDGIGVVLTADQWLRALP